MSFKNLEQRFNEKVNDLYRASNQTFEAGKVSNGKFDEPFIRRRVGEGYVSKLESRATPVASAAQDVRRLSLFFLNGKGILTLGKQQLLQTGNTFSKTRLLNPLYGIANAVPFLHVQRHKNARSFGNLLTKTDTSDGNVKKMGQLQEETYKKLSSKGTPASLVSRFLSTITSPLKNAISPFTTLDNVREYGWDKSRPELGKNTRDYFVFKSLRDRKYNTSTFSVDRQLFGVLENGRYATYLGTDAQYRTTNIRVLGRYNRNERLRESFKEQNVRYGNLDTEDTPYIKYFVSGEGSIRGLVQFNQDNTIKSQNARDLAEARTDKSKRISYIKDVASIQNLGLISSSLVTGLEPYKPIATGFDDAIVVSFGIGSNDTPIQFRAFIKDLNETVSPEYKSYQYIGRIEKFVSYVSVQREISFKLSVIALSKDELQSVWRRINFLTGLAYPYGFNRGIMQPNIVRLTIGNLYNNQPGYITGLSNNFSEVMESWDIDEEVPMGATISLRFVLIEKRTSIASSPFYHITENAQGFRTTLTNSSPNDSVT